MKYLRWEPSGQTGILYIDREKSLNALNYNVLRELDAFIEERVQENELRALILTGAGDKAFIAGADIKEMCDLDHLGMMRFTDLGLRVARRLETAPFMTIAAVNGYALGGGLELALSCDFIYASKKAKLGLPEVTLGLIPGFGGTQRLCRAAGARMAKELVMSGRIISAEQAREYQIVNHLSEAESLLSDCQRTIQEVLKNSFCAVLQAKNAINYGQDIGITEACELEKNMCAVAFATADRKEGMTAFVEKREPAFA
ncbi:MAG: 3-hydroxybutyryl-CoA dehydrogenase [Waddliaceae bacterium]|nr:3-hydroxybutyryl-CoA dehydrogenase [Waddliaceae bacterium]